MANLSKQMIEAAAQMAEATNKATKAIREFAPLFADVMHEHRERVSIAWFMRLGRRNEM